MARPLFETKEQKQKENEARKATAILLDKTVVKLPMRYKIDWVVVDDKGTPVMLIEYKNRDINLKQYDEVILSLDKVMAGLELARFCQCPFYFAVEFNDAYRWAHIQDGVWRVEWHGRSVKTRDWQDVEPCVMIHNSKFKEIK